MKKTGYGVSSPIKGIISRLLRFKKQNAQMLLEHLPIAFHKYLYTEERMYKGKMYITMFFVMPDFHPIHVAFKKAKKQMEIDLLLAEADKKFQELKNEQISQGLQSEAIDQF